MSQFFKNPAKCDISCDYVKDYVIYGLQKFVSESVCRSFDEPGDNGKMYIQRILKHSGNKFRMYGSADELTEEIRKFKNYPETYRLFGDQYFSLNTPEIYYSLNRKKRFINRADLYVLLHNMIISTIKHEAPKYFQASVEKLILELVPPPGGPVEHVELGKIDFRGILEHIQRLYKLSKNFSQNELEEFDIFDDLDYEERKKFDKIDKKKTRKSQKDEILQRFLDAKFLDSLEEIIDKFEDIFEFGYSPQTIRVFEDGKNSKFVIRREIFEAINLNSEYSEGIEYDDEKENISRTIDFRDLKNLFGERLGDIEFIRVPIRRTKHKAVYIQGPSREILYILIQDAFFEILKFLIHGAKLFQKCHKKEEILKLLTEFFQVFHSDFDCKCFIAVIHMQKLKENLFSNFQIINNRKIKEIRDVSGFSQRDLESELQYLGLTTTFPEIRNFAELVYSEVDRKKRERILRTCDMFDAVEQCQIICFLNMFPELKYFLHDQEACHRVVGLKCMECEKEIAEKMQEAAENAKISPIFYENLSKNEEENEEILNETMRISDSEDENPEDVDLVTWEIVEAAEIPNLEHQKINKIKENPLELATEMLGKSLKLVAETKNELKIARELLEKSEKRLEDVETELRDLKAKFQESLEKKINNF
ncbi:hypothetical protein L3Y34_017061 [Caenorhabditis briggsae]|uniref:Uncharacterized protein n=1 Tax=Caenorhabditis briggsae TaxID=6238 RepID=A0AAE9DGG3_CAEBR|nr:hypothetical protein L3Y34_017061 [Caenorhabditis briggsae]